MPSPTQEQIERLEANGCSSEDWSLVSFDPDSDPDRLRNVRFMGTVSVGANRGDVTVDGVDLPCGIYDATLADCAVGDGVRIARIGSVLSRYDIARGAVIEDVAALTADAGSLFGSGTEVEAVNEGGGRVVRLLPALSAQTAWLQLFRRHSARLDGVWARLVEGEVEACRRDRGEVGEQARIVHCGALRNVLVGPHADIRGVAGLEDGTILSCTEHPTVVGSGVQARHFVVAEGASVTDGVLLDRAYVGQATKLGKQFSVENSLFFANCEGYHGEALAVFAGPYTVTHHKSTLLVAAAYSFYNAGSGTNASNHMYKLGPVHQGVFERGSKTGSFSYVLHETHVGAFSAVIGKHYTNIDTPDLPFSYIHESGGQSEIVPGMNLYSVGTARDAEKWPARDRRRAPEKRDLITFDVFSPFTVEKMRAGRAELMRLHESTPKEKRSVLYGGVSIKRLLFRTCARTYTQAVTRYLAGRVLDRLAGAGAASWSGTQDAMVPAEELSDPWTWTDVGGLLMPVERLQKLEDDLVSGALASFESVSARLRDIADAYARDEWAFVCAAFRAEFGFAPWEMTRQQALEVVSVWAGAAESLQSKLLDDSKKEFDDFARIGYGLGMTEEERQKEFTAVRGSAERNTVVQKLAAEKSAIGVRASGLKELISRL